MNPKNSTEKKVRAQARNIPLEYKKKYSLIFKEKGFNDQSRKEVQGLYKKDYKLIFGPYCDFKPIHRHVLRRMFKNMEEHIKYRGVSSLQHLRR